jgi:hypothetical protein
MVVVEGVWSVFEQLIREDRFAWLQDSDSMADCGNPVNVPLVSVMKNPVSTSAKLPPPVAVVGTRLVVSSMLKWKVKVPTTTFKLTAIGAIGTGIGCTPNVSAAAGLRPVTPEFVFKLGATVPTCRGVSVFWNVSAAMQPPGLVHPAGGPEVLVTVTLPPGATPNVNDPLAITA